MIRYFTHAHFETKWRMIIMMIMINIIIDFIMTTLLPTYNISSYI